MAKKTKSCLVLSIEHHASLYIIVVAAVLLATLFLALTNYRTTRVKAGDSEYTTNSVVPYVDGNDATNQVASFYRQYIDVRASASFRAKYIAGYGNKNLVFYSTYYQHGFDPIVCSVALPLKVTTALVSTGHVATVRATAVYADASSQNILATVVLDDEGLSIDSITCPGDKGQLPPSSSEKSNF